jgi:hypothetical protein
MTTPQEKINRSSNPTAKEHRILENWGEKAHTPSLVGSS